MPLQAFQFVFEQAVLHNVDDHIFAGVEGRPTAMERQADELAEKEKRKDVPDRLKTGES